MPLKRKHDPGYKLPEVIAPEENCCICIPIPNDFNHKMAFLGQLDELGYWWNWERDDLKQGREAAAVWREIVACIREEMNMSGCGCGDDKGTPTNQRYTEDGHLEVSYDGGETWENGDAIDPRFTSPIFTPIPGADGEEKRCAAANSAMAIIEQAKSDASTALGGASVFANLVAAVVSLLAATGIGVVAGVVVGIMGAILVAIANVGQATFDGSFTTLVWDEFFCSLFCNMEDDGSFTDAGWKRVVDEAAQGASYPANEWLSHIIKTMSPVGLTNAARSGYVGTRDCESCDCPGEWCYFFAFDTAGAEDWEKSTTDGFNNGVMDIGTGWVTTDTVNTVQNPDTGNRAIYIMNNHSITTVTKVVLTYSIVAGSYDATFWDAVFIALNGVRVTSVTRLDIVNGTNVTLTWEGSVSSVTKMELFLRSSRDNSAPHTYSGSASIRSVRVEGLGFNPFGDDNCIEE